MEDVVARLEIPLDEPLARDPGNPLLVQLTPRVRSRVIERAGAVRVRLDLAIDVVVAKSDVVPSAGAELGKWNLQRRAVRGHDVRRQHALHLTMQKQDIEACLRIGSKRGPIAEDV